MSVIRQDPTTKEWVILATERGRRPHEFSGGDRARSTMAQDPDCPFCRGNEAMTPAPTLTFETPDGTGWTTRVIPNKFAALRLAGEPRRTEHGRLFREMAGVGVHEVIIETPVHNLPMPLMEEAELERILHAYQARYRALREDPRLKYVIIFRNHGETAGTSLVHPHSQLVATPIAPSLIRRKYDVAISHFDDTGRCLYCDVAEEERVAKQRMLIETNEFVVFHPFASRVPYETWILPTRHQPSFGQAAPEELAALSRVLRRVLRSLFDALGNPDFNLIVHSAPTEDETKAYYLWHIQVLPRLSAIAGFELGSGIYITTMSPEETAAFMRSHLGAG